MDGKYIDRECMSVLADIYVYTCMCECVCVCVTGPRRFMTLKELKLPDRGHLSGSVGTGDYGGSQGGDKRQ